MIISVASGKGGTGKTLVATSLALSLGEGVQLLDCDVEETNAHILLKPTITSAQIAFFPLSIACITSWVMLPSLRGNMHPLVMIFLFRDHPDCAYAGASSIRDQSLSILHRRQDRSSVERR